MKATSSSVLTKSIITVLIVFLCISIILPFLHILALAFNDGQDATRGGVYIFPRVFSLDNFAEVFRQDELLNGLVISVFRTVTVTVLGVFLMSMAAYALTIKTLPGRGFITFFVFFTMLFSGGTVPYYLVLSELNLTHSIWVYIFPNLYSATNILLLRSSFVNLPTETIEAARIDGASEFRIFWNHVLPMSKPVLATVSLFTAVGQWNDWFSGSFYVRQRDLKPLATLLQEMLTRQTALSDLLQSQSGFTDYALLDQITITGQSLQMATIIVVILPIILMYPFIQKYFVQGITIGAIKG
ncbi:carbohydrate ABC transporter permease [Fundicoccus culcitae]|uniref:Carbohydrate ABC transporter permease n=1 Tax=Fundicoccus culcitae TaxID=2969821 RepID=A0ABY5P5S6_9LACT|nr:carbohydrate ABC transporter permease [Fundicoccus culcitae]UUX33748.1 carbohydrate ABC transporter permease [Fundicoccus culcitae]